MRLKLYSLIAIISLCVGMGAASAADLIIQHAAPAPAFSWAGPYIGLETGAVSSHFYSPTKQISTNDINLIFGRPKDTPLVGIFAGYNIALGQHAILGLDGNIDFHHSESLKIATFPEEPGEYDRYQDTALAAARIRLGYAQGSFMPYIAGGVAVVHSGSIDGILPEGIANPKKYAHYRRGWNIGAGIDYAATNHIFLRADYRFSQVKIHNYTTLAGNVVEESDPHIGTKSHQLRLGAAYKF